MSSSRKYHQKSKTGCGSCKRRRVKCDEARPTCRSCVRTQMVCIYPTDAHMATPKSQGSPASATPSSPRIRSSAAPEEQTFDLLDLGLMNHFDTVTTMDLFPLERARIGWQKMMPQQAQSHPLLMHGILAISAIHAAVLNPDKAPDYRIRALHHQNVAILMYRTALSTMTKETSPAVFGFCMILTVLVLASTRLTDAQLTLDDILDKIEILRGSIHIWNLEAESIIASELSMLLPTKVVLQDTAVDGAMATAMSELEDLVQESHYVSAAQSIRVCIGQAIEAPDEVPMALRWVVSETEGEFWKGCKARDAKALLILAHYAIVLRHYTQTWWLAGWSDLLINAISDGLSESDKELIGWNQRLDFLMHA